MDGNCLNQSISGYYTPGTYQQYVLGPATYVTPIPDALDSAEAAPFRKSFFAVIVSSVFSCSIEQPY